MDSSNAHRADVTQLLVDHRKGDAQALDRLMPLVYDELSRIAHLQLRRRRPGQTLDTSALVHEAYARLADQTRSAWNDRAHFFAVSAQAMRQILIDYARRQCAQKRGGKERPATLDEALLAPAERAGVLLALDEALTRLSTYSERQAKVVEMRFFGGLTEEEIAEVLGVSERTVNRDWRKARLWLNQFLAE